MKEFIKKHRVPIIVVASLVVLALIVTGVLLVQKPKPNKGSEKVETTTTENSTTESAAVVDDGDNVTTEEWVILVAQKFGFNSYISSSPYFEDVKDDNIIFSYVQTMVENEILDAVSGKLGADEEISQKSALIQISKIYGDTYIENRFEKDELTEEDYINFAVENIGINLTAIEDGFTYTEATDAINKTWEHYLSKEYGNFEKIEYTENVIDLSSVEDYVYENNTVLVSTEHEITEGKVLIFATKDEYKSLIALKVTAVENDGNNYILDVTEPTLDEIVVAMNIEFSQIANWDNFIPAEGVTVIDGESVAATGDFNHTGSEKTFEVNFTDKKLKYSDEWEDIYGKLTLNGINIDNVNYFKDSKGNMMSKYKEGVEIVGKITIKDLIIKGYAEYDGNLEFNVESGATISSSLSIKGKKEEQMIRVGELPIYTFGSPFSFVVDVYVVATMEGEIKVEPKVTAIASAKKTKNSGVNFTGDITTSDLNSTISGKVKLAVCPDAVVCFYGVADLMDLYIEAGIGADAKYDLKDPGKIKIEIYAPTLKAGVGKDKKSILSGVLGIKYEVKIMDKKDALFKCPYIEELVFDVPAIIDFITGEETTTEESTSETTGNITETVTQPVTEAPKPTEPVTQKPTEAPVPTEPVDTREKIPAGCTYTVMATGEVLAEGDYFPDMPGRGDVYIAGDYKYCYEKAIEIGYTDYGAIYDYLNNWHVDVLINTKTTYGAILSSIAGQPVTDMYQTFKECPNLIDTPLIPNSITNMNESFAFCTSLKTVNNISTEIKELEYTFWGCTSLKNVPTIPSNVKELYYTFYGCSSLTTMPAIPNGVNNMEGAFRDCVKLMTVSAIPNSVTSLDSTFRGCTSLINSPEIPLGVIDMFGTFDGCINLINAPEIPDSVENLNFTFSGCKKIVSAPIIPNKVTSLNGTFSACTSLINAPVIPDGIEHLDNTFSECTNLIDAPVIPNSVITMYNTFACTSLVNAPIIPKNVTDMSRTFFGCSSLTGMIVVNANPTDYTWCFFGVDLINQNITLTGTSTMLDEIRATASNY